MLQGSIFPSGSHPLRELFSLRSDVDEAWPRLQHTKRVSRKVPFCLAVALEEALFALTLDLASPYPPLNRPELRSVGHEAQDGDEEPDDCFDGYIDGERRRGL